MEAPIAKRGTYRYSVPLGVHPTITYEWHSLRVEIIGVTDKMYDVKLLGYHATNKKAPGDKMRVRRKSVVIDKPQDVIHELSPEREIKLPYKDN